MRAFVLSLLVACSYDTPTDVCDGPCSVCGIDRAISNASATANGNEQIFLDGIFVDGTVVNFHGAAQPQNLDTRFPFRAAVTVPQDATAGDLTVTWPDGTISTSIPFRKPAFGLSVGTFRALDDQTTFGQHYDASPYRRGHTAIVLRHRLYLVGGVIGSEPDPSVEMRLVGLDGSITHGVAAPALAHGRAFHAMVRAGEHVYVIGGRRTGDIIDNSVESARINKNDGSLDGFEPVAGVTLRTPRSHHACALLGNYIYVFGGLDAGHQPLASIERAPVYENGAIGDFEALGDVALPAPRASFTVAVVDERLYVIGGRDDNGDVFTILGAHIYADSSYLGSFETSGRLVQPRSHHASIVIGTEIVVAGGEANGAAIDTVERAQITQLEGTELDFVLDTPKLRDARRDAVAVIIGNFVYLLGGEKAPGQPSLLYERAPFITPAAGIRSFDVRPSTPKLFPARDGHAVVVVGDELYVIGGTDDTNTVLRTIQHAKIFPDGTLGPFAGAGRELVTPRTGASVTVFRNKIIVAGGRTTGQVANRSVEELLFDDLGQIMSSTTVGPLTFDRDRMATLVLPNAIYWIAGTSGNDAIDRADIVGASLGSPMMIASITIPDRRGAAGVLVGNEFYVLGGVDGTSSRRDASMFTVGPDHTLAPGSPVSLDQDWRRDGHRLVAVGDAIYMLGGDYDSSIPAPSRVLQRTAEGVLATGDPGLAFGPRRDFATVTLGDYVYAIAGTVNGVRDSTLPSARIETF
jgi:hypothetical protein